MAASGQEPTIMDRGLLTNAEKDFLRGEKEDVDQEQYRYNIRSNFRSRMEELDDDLELLREAGEGDLVEEFYNQFGRMERLETEVDRLRKELEEERTD